MKNNQDYDSVNNQVAFKPEKSTPSRCTTEDICSFTLELNEELLHPRSEKGFPQNGGGVSFDYGSVSQTFAGYRPLEISKLKTELL